MNEVMVKIGPWHLGPFQRSNREKGETLFFYVSDTMVCGQDKSGGIAYWTRVGPMEMAREGLA